MQTLLLTILVLGVLVFVHELGHFMTAKWAGISVPRFSIGLGPRVTGVQIGETDYCLSAIPFGGYVKMAGMEGEEAFEQLEGGADPEIQEARVPPERRFENKTVLQRLLVLSAGVAMNFLLGWLIYVGLAYSGGLPTVPGTRVASVDEAALERHEALGALAFGTTIREVGGQAVSNWNEVNSGIIDGEGPSIELLLDTGETVSVPVVDDDMRREVAMALTPLVPPVVDLIEPESPAAKSGLEIGDRVVSFDGVETPTFGSMSEEVRARPNQIVPVVVLRTVDGEERQLTISVRTGVQQTPRPSDGKFVDTGWLGVGARIDRIELGPIDAVVAGSVATWRAGTLIVNGVYQLVTGDVSLRALGGPVAIGQLTGHFARQGLSSLLAWVALFSINLAILNLLPIPVLDGGHIVFLGIEATRGRPLSARQKLRLSQVGLAFLVLLMAWAFTADILRLVGF
ncbi:MAG TPA: RIP metalloprotease RseP [Gemmatimonadota bacterium]|nr:RIP metalloprotease RseP [Gemmatimonadota bacterium]